MVSTLEIFLKLKDGHGVERRAGSRSVCSEKKSVISELIIVLGKQLQVIARCTLSPCHHGSAYSKWSEIVGD